MGFDEGRIVLESPNGTYYPGQTVNGKLVFHQEKDKTFRGIYAKLKGFCKVHWTTQESYTVNGKRETRTVSHDSYEEYANVKTFLIGGESGEHYLKPGDHEFPFSFHLPQNCPSSFEGSYGHVRYQIKVVVDRAFKFDQEKKVAVRVYNLLDLNKDLYCREPIEMEFNATYCCCCIGSGTTNTVINVPVSGFCPGQIIPIEVSCSNNGTVDVDDIKLSVVKKIKFIATSNPDERTDKDTIAKIRKGPVPANTSRNYTVEMEVPALDVYNLNDCRYIHITYQFKAVVSPSGCHSDSEGTRNIVIGNVPLVGFQDNVQNPLQDQMPQQVAAVTQQPLSSYPGNQSYPPNVSPYPGGNAPYPGGNAPYPGGNAPYPGGNAPYPGGNIPYPTGSAPYPTPAAYPSEQKPPYPNANAPYPTNDTKTPYPVENVPNLDNPPPYPGNTFEKSPNPNISSPYSTEKPPYPVESSPYTTGNTPYPASTSPYPTGNSPYPARTSPYPAENPPYPTGNTPYPPTNPSNPTGTPSSGPGISTLRTGTIGFRVPGSAAPITPNLSMPSPVPVNPYATASAPPPESPDEKKE